MKYRKKPVVIEAMQLPSMDEDATKELIDFLNEMDREWHSERDGSLIIETLEGDHTAMPGDYIIKGVKGEYYPCKPDIFEMTYEPAE
jgi:hypothetical protein